MRKNVVQDVVPPKKSIRNVKLPSRSGASGGTRENFDEPINLVRKPSRSDIPSRPEDEFTRPVSLKRDLPPPPPQIPMQAKPESQVNIPSYKYDYDEPRKSSRKGIYIAIAVVVLAGAFGISALFKSAVIRVTPKQDVKPLDDSFKAVKDMTGNALGFQIVTISKEADKTVAASGEQNVDVKARGTIVIYNNTAQVQKLVATTRFQTPEGLIYRLVSPATVPAQTAIGGKTVAGSVEAVVEADKTGSGYNIGLKDFTIPGFKGDPKYTTVFARSKTEMSGGFSGKQKTVAKDVLAQAEAEMGDTLKNSLSKDIVSQIPDNFILYPDSLTYRIDPAVQISSTDTSAVIRKKATAIAVIFDKSALTRAILSKVAPDTTDAAVKVTDLENLAFAYASDTPADISAAQSINFTLKGDADLVWMFDQNKLKADLLGVSKANASKVIDSYDTIKEAWVETHPFWNSTIPKDPKKVTLVNTLTK